MADFEVIASETLDTDSSSWVIDEIPQDYTHLEIDFHARTDTFTSGTWALGMSLNTYTGANVYGYGVAYSNNSINGTAIDQGPNGANRGIYLGRLSGDATSASTYAINKMFIANYSDSSTTHKQVVCEQSAATAWSPGGSWWMGFSSINKTNCGAITKVTFWPDWSTSQKIKAGSCYTLAGWK